jgi:hypothetical protein
MTQDKNIDATLAERGGRYGEFDEHARITQALKEVMVSGRSWSKCTASQKEALEMVAHKIGRIVNGDPNYADSWHDIIGYVRLVEVQLEAKETTPLAVTDSLDRLLASQQLKGR